MKNKAFIGNFITLLTTGIWAITFISTKVLLQNLDPLEILLYRFVIAYFILMIVHPNFKKISSLKEESLFILAGISGVTLYFFIENVALQYTLASNVALFVSAAPILTAILSHFFVEKGGLTKQEVFGFLIAIFGIFLVIFNGNFALKINPIGDFLSIFAAAMWAVYSIVLKKINTNYCYHNLFITRKIFFYGIIFMIPLVFALKIDFRFERLMIPSVALNIIFLSIVASAICFVMWNIGVDYIGAIKASNYIYITPLVTAVMSVLILKEKITIAVLIGAVLLLIGLYISQNGFKNPIRFILQAKSGKKNDPQGR